MRRIMYGSLAFWNTLLLLSVIFGVFILPVLPAEWPRSIVRAVYTFIYFSAILSLEKRSNYTLILFFSTLIIEWVSGMFNFEILFMLAKLVKILFFLVIVGSLIRQIATAKKVSVGVIVDSLAGYLLLGLLYSIFIIFIIQKDPGAFTNPQTPVTESGESMSTSVPVYFSFVTLATLGYGDIIPLKPYTRSLAILIAVSGQFYIAIIVALLVGKFSAQSDSPGNG